MIIAIFGYSKVGKTASANAISAELKFPARSCGNELKRRAIESNVAGTSLPDFLHREIDNETVAWASDGLFPNRIIEGRFLNYVLGSLSTRPFLIQLTADPLVRLQRMNATNLKVDDVLALDAEDEKFCNRFYGGRPPIEAAISIDTSHMTVESCALHISDLVRTSLRHF